MLYYNMPTQVGIELTSNEWEKQKALKLIWGLKMSY